MQSFLNRKRVEPLSLEELSELLPEFATIMYDDLENKSISEIIGDRDGAILYYDMHTKGGKTKDIGHFSLILKENNKLEYFSSYGFSVFAEIDKTRSDPRKFNKLFPKNMIVNKTKFQRQRNTDTCGRWVLLRAKFKNMSLSQFTKLFGNRRFSIQSLDDLVILATAALVDLD